MSSIAEYSARRSRAGCVIAIASIAIFVVIVAGATGIFPGLGESARLAAALLAGVLITATARLTDYLYMRPERERAFRAGCNLCIACGFDLSAHEPDVRCPECGETHPTRTRIDRWREALGVKPDEPPPGDGARS